MGSIQRQDSFDSDDHRFYYPDDLQEARTLTNKEMQRAREEALYVLKTRSPEEAFKIFTQGLRCNVGNPLGPGEADSVESVRPPETGNGRTQTPAPPPQN